MNDWSELKKSIGNFKACGKTVGHGSSCEIGYLCGECTDRMAMQDQIKALIAENESMKSSAEMLIQSLKNRTATCAQDGETIIRLMEENEALRKDAERYRLIRANGYREVDTDMWSGVGDACDKFTDEHYPYD